MEDKNEIITLRGVTILRQDIEERYQCKLSDMEWQIFKSNVTKKWKEDEDSIRKLVFKHVKSTFDSMDYKLELKGKDLIFRKLK